MDSFSKRLEAALMIRQMRQSVLASKLGVSRAIITMYLKGKTVPRKNRLCEISEVLNVQAAWLQGYDVSMMNTEKIEDIRDEIKVLFISLPYDARVVLLDSLGSML